MDSIWGTFAFVPQDKPSACSTSLLTICRNSSLRAHSCPPHQRALPSSAGLLPSSWSSRIYDLCRFYALGMTGDPPEFPMPWEPVTHSQVRDLLKSAHSISQPYLILAHSADSVTAVSMLREWHRAMCLQCLQVDLRDKSVKLSFCPFCAYTGGEGGMTFCTSTISS